MMTSKPALLSSTCRHDPSFREFSVFSVWIVFSMQLASFGLRLLSSVFWVQMHRLGAQTDTPAMSQPVDFEGRLSTCGLANDRPSPSHAVSMSEEILGGSIYSPATFSNISQFTDEPYFGTEVSDMFHEFFLGVRQFSLRHLRSICRSKVGETAPRLNLQGDRCRQPRLEYTNSTSGCDGGDPLDPA